MRPGRVGSHMACDSYGEGFDANPPGADGGPGYPRFLADGIQAPPTTEKG